MVAGRRVICVYTPHTGTLRTAKCACALVQRNRSVISKYTGGLLVNNMASQEKREFDKYLKFLTLKVSERAM